MKIPRTFSEYRKVVSQALHEAGAPPSLVSEVGNVDEEGHIAQALWPGWENVEMVLHYPESVHDVIIEVVTEYQDPMNYGPGRKPEKVDGPELAQKVVEILLKED